MRSVANLLSLRVRQVRHRPAERELTTALLAGDVQTGEYDALWAAVRQPGASFETWEQLAKFSLTLVRLVPLFPA